jgi:cytochrome c oxidase subunit 4
MDAHDTAAIRKQTRIYVAVFAALAVLTVITVAISYIPALHERPALGITVALAIALIKGSLVAAYFMHLIDERKAIYSILILTAVFFAVLMATPLLEHMDNRGLIP